MDNALVLIIEDEPEIAEILEAYFIREGFRTISAGDGVIGLAHHATLKPNLAILDVKLPGQDGYEVLAAIRRRGDTPVIMVTALAEDLTSCRRCASGPTIMSSSLSTRWKSWRAPRLCCAGLTVGTPEP